MSTPENFRNMENYNPLSSEFHTILWKFKRTKNSIEYKFQTWLTEERFVNNKPPVGSLNYSETLTGLEFETFIAQNESILLSADSAIIPIAGNLLSSDFTGWIVDHYSIDVEELIFDSLLKNSDGREAVARCGDTTGKFTTIRENYQEVFDRIGFACLVRASRRNQFYKQLLIDKLNILIADSEAETKAFYEAVLAQFEDK